jgi:hypothetical protein
MRCSIGGWVANKAPQPPMEQPRQRVLHRHRAAQQGGGTGVGAEFALAREPGDDDRGQQAEHDFADEHGDHVADAGAAVVAAAQQHLVDEEADHPRHEHHERVDHALDQGQRDHVAIGDVGDFVAQHGFDFVTVHALQQAGGHRHQGRILEGAGGERVGLAFVHGHFRHADVGAFGQLAHGVDQPQLGGVGRIVDHPRAGRPLGHWFAHQQRNDRSGEADHQREHQQRADVDAGTGDRPAHAQHVQHERQHQHHGEVGGEEQDDTFHKKAPGDWEVLAQHGFPPARERRP